MGEGSKDDAGTTTGRADPRVADHHTDARRIAALLWHFDRARRIFEQRATLGVADMRMLWMFSDGRARTLAQIAGELGLEQSTVNRQVNAALAAGLLDRFTDSRSRPYRFTVSAAGQRAFARNLDAAFGVYEHALGALDGDRARFLANLGVFVTAHGEAVAASGAAPGTTDDPDTPATRES